MPDVAPTRERHRPHLGAPTLAGLPGVGRGGVRHRQDAPARRQAVRGSGLPVIRIDTHDDEASGKPPRLRFMRDDEAEAEVEAIERGGTHHEGGPFEPRREMNEGAHRGRRERAPRAAAISSATCGKGRTPRSGGGCGAEPSPRGPWRLSAATPRQAAAPSTTRLPTVMEVSPAPGADRGASGVSDCVNTLPSISIASAPRAGIVGAGEGTGDDASDAPAGTPLTDGPLLAPAAIRTEPPPAHGEDPSAACATQAPATQPAQRGERAPSVLKGEL